MLLDDNTRKAVCQKFRDTFHFYPTIDTRIIPFHIVKPHIVYDISKTDLELLDQLISNALLNCTLPGEKLYALDWFHAYFLYDPRIPEEQKSVYLGDHPFMADQGPYASFPFYYPDGDYYFFIDEQFRFGYLSHPWREEVWIFGDRLIAEFEKIYKQLGWNIKEDL